VHRWSASGQRFRKRCQSQRDNESAILFEIPEICKALIIILYCKVDKTRCLTRDITLTDFEDRPSLETLTTEIDSLVNASMADSKWKTYKTAVESFQSFRKLYSLQDTWPAPLYDLLFCIAYMSHTGLSASTITTYISGISTMHKLNGHTDNTKSFLVTKILEGSKRKNSPKADLRLPVSMNLLKRLIQSLPFVCTSVYESTMFASAFSLCFFGLLRVGEITSQSKGRAGKHVIHISDIKLVRDD
jgi:hypothetical protein